MPVLVSNRCAHLSGGLIRGSLVYAHNSDCVPPAGWAEAGGANQPHGMSVMSFLAGCVLSPRDDGTVCR